MTARTHLQDEHLARLVEDFSSSVGLPATYWSCVRDAVTVMLGDIDAARAVAPGSCLIVGLSGGPGTGKSTLARLLRVVLSAQGLRVAALSLDELYLSGAARARLAEEVHPLLRTRGVPGTHDVALGLSVLHAARDGGPVVIPRFDKAVDEPVAQAQWTRVDGPLDVLIFEGWCVGAPPQEDAQLAKPINDLERAHDPDGVWRAYVNAALAGPYRALFAPIGYRVHLRAASLALVHQWRLGQEAALRDQVRQAGRPAHAIMSDDQVARFVSHFERLVLHMRAVMPGLADRVVDIDEERVCRVRAPEPRGSVS